MPDALIEPTDSPAPANGDAPAVVTKTTDDELCQWVDGLYEEAAKRKKDEANQDQWDDWEDQFWGQHWPADVPSFKPPIVANELKTLMLQEVSDLTDNPIKIFVQKDRTKPDRDETVEKAIQAYWKREHVDFQIMLAALVATVKPCAFLKVTYDPLAEYGQGKVLTEYAGPEHITPDPDALDDERWRYVIEDSVLDLVNIRALWPEAGARVEPEASVSLKATQGMMQKMASFFRGNSKYQGPLYAPGPGGTPQGYIKARAQVLTVFIYDEEQIEEIEEIIKPSTGEKSLTPRTKKKYPNGRMIQTANGVVLFDGPNPYHGRFPYVRVLLQPCFDRFWPPVSIISETGELQRAADKMDSLWVENGIRLNGGILFADANSGIKPGRWANIPGQVILKTPGTQAEIKYPPPMPQDMVNGGEKLRSIQRRVQGFPDSRVGQGQRGNVSAELTETEISQSQGLSRLRGRLLHMAVQKTVEMVFQRMAQYYLTPRYIPFIANEQWSPIAWRPIEKADTYAVHLDESSFQVRSKTLMQRLYLTLAKMGMMPHDEVLKMLDIPDAVNIAAKMNQQLFLQAMARGKVKPGGKK